MVLKVCNACFRAESESADGEVEGIDPHTLREMQAVFSGELLSKEHKMKLTEMGYNVLRNAGIRPYPGDTALPDSFLDIDNAAWIFVVMLISWINVMSACTARRGPREHDPTPPPASGAQQDQLYAAAFYFDVSQMQAHSYRMMVNRPKKGRPEDVLPINRGDVTPPPPLPLEDGRNDGLRRFDNREDFEEHANGVLYPYASGRKLTAGNADKLWKLSNFFVDMREKRIILGILGTGLMKSDRPEILLLDACRYRALAACTYLQAHANEFWVIGFCRRREHRPYPPHAGFDLWVQSHPGETARIS